MDAEFSWWWVLGLVLIAEGLLPFVSPRGWRELFTQLMAMRDGQIRFFGLVCIALGLMLLWWVK